MSEPTPPGDSPPPRPAASAVLDPLIGQVVLERYEIVRRIGSGGMGAVYIGQQKAVGREVALKVLRADLMSNEHIRERFRREAEIIGKLRHPNTIQLIDYGESADGLAVMVMELLKGQALNDRLRDGGPIPIMEAINVGAEIASSLSEAHSLGLVHRDLKPANIFLVEVAGQTHVKVLDFGIARILDEEATRLTSTGQVFGTPRYMSPEQALSTGEVDARSDVYSLGLIIYECIVGQPPFVAQTSIQYLSAHSSMPPPKLRSHFSEAPEPLELLIDACLAKTPEERPQTADDVAQALGSIRRMMESGGAMQAIDLRIPQKNHTRPVSGLDSTHPSARKGTEIPGDRTRENVLDATIQKGLTRPPSQGVSPVVLGSSLLALVVVIALAVIWWRGQDVTVIESALDAGELAAAASDAGSALVAMVDHHPPSHVDVEDSDGGTDEVANADGAVANEDDAGLSPHDLPPLDGGPRKTKGRTKIRSRDPGTKQSGDGYISESAHLTLPVVEQEESLAKKAKACAAGASLAGPATLTIKGCPKGCTILVNEKCAGTTPAQAIQVPNGFQEVAVVCGGKLKRKTQLKLDSEKPASFSCR